MVRFSIIGSCVSRDVLSFIDGDVVGRYLARASLASVASARSEWAAALPIVWTEKARPWHQRMARADLDKTHKEYIADMAGDWVLIDLIEERVELVETDAGEYVTRSQMLALASNFDALAGRPSIPVFSKDGYEIWRRKLDGFSAMLRDVVDERRVIVHRSMYAGDDKRSVRANSHLNRMYDDLQRVFPIASAVSATPDAVIAGIHNKHGKAPFHYEDAYYLQIVQQLAAVVGEPLPLRSAFTMQSEQEVLSAAL